MLYICTSDIVLLCNYIIPSIFFMFIFFLIYFSNDVHQSIGYLHSCSNSFLLPKKFEGNVLYLIHIWRSFLITS